MVSGVDFSYQSIDSYSGVTQEEHPGQPMQPGTGRCDCLIWQLNEVELGRMG